MWGEWRCIQGRLEGRNHLEDPDIDGMIKLIFEEWD
jgi:hypothetical protein